MTGSYKTGGKSFLCFSGVYKAEIGTTVRVASIRDDGQTFQDRRTPVGVGGMIIFFSPVNAIKSHTVALLDVFEIEHVGRCKAVKI
jgi:hypothetical protein